MSAPSYLKRRKLGWYVQLAVPRSLQPALGCKVITRSLRTRDHSEALRRRHRVIAELQAQLESLPEVAPKGTPAALLQQALDARAAVDGGTMRNLDAEASLDHDMDEFLSRAARQYGVDEEGHPLLPAAEVSTIRRAHKALSGTLQSTLAYQREAYLAEVTGRLNASTVEAKRRSAEAFGAWFGDDRACSDVIRRDVGRYVSDVVLRRTQGDTALPLSAATRKKELSDLRSWFDWMMVRGQVDGNPFDRMSATVRGSSRGKAPARRPWLPDELAAVLHGVPPDDPLWAFTAIAAYTGMRREEVGELRVSSFDGDILKVEQGKTAAAVRRVPVHPAIAPLVASLAESSTDGYLLPGLSRGGPDERRSWNLGKRFGRVIRDLGITDPRLDFHAFRATVITALEGAGVPESTIQLIVGHKRQGMTFGTYSAGLPDQVMREALLQLSYGSLDKYIRDTGAGVVIKARAARSRTLNRLRVTNPRDGRVTQR